MWIAAMPISWGSPTPPPACVNGRGDKFQWHTSQSDTANLILITAFLRLSMAGVWDALVFNAGQEADLRSQPIWYQFTLFRLLIRCSIHRANTIRGISEPK